MGRRRKRLSIKSHQPKEETRSVPLRMADVINVGVPNDTGITVTQRNAMSIAAVNACVRRISADMGGLPFFVYRRAERGREKDTGHPVYRLLHDRPNEEMPPLIFKECLTSHVLLWGNGYAYVEKQGSYPTALYPLLPDRTRPVRKSGELFYETAITYPDGTIRVETLSPEFVLHLRGLTYDGITGISVIEQAANVLGCSLGMSKYSAKFFANGGTFRGYVTHPGRLSKEARVHLKSTLSNFTGADNAHGIPLFEEGLTYNPIGVAPEQAQWVSSMQFSVTDIARLFLMPPHKIGEMGRATWSNVEEENISYVETTLMRWINAWEEEVNTKLFLESEKDTYYAELSVDALKRGNQTQRDAHYQSGLMNGWLTPNQICEWENLPTYEGGDTYYQPANLVAIKPPEEAPQPAPEPTANYDLLVEDATRRILTKEINAVRRAAKKHLQDEQSEEAFAAWLEEFYEDHKQTIRQTFTPVLLTVAINDKWPTERIPEAIDRVVAQHVTRSIEDLTRGMSFESVTETLNGWQTRSLQGVQWR